MFSRPTRFFALYKKLSAIKDLPRTGWGRGVPSVESVAAHSWRMAVMILYHQKTLEQMGVNIDRAIRMALYHDTSEAVVGDVVPMHVKGIGRRLTKEKAKKLELAAAKKLSRTYRCPDLYHDIVEYENESSSNIERRVVKDLDVLDMLMQAYEYRAQDPSLDFLDEFMLMNKARIKLPFFMGITDEIERVQNELLKTRKQPVLYPPLSFYAQMGTLKHYRKQDDPQTMSDHMFGAAIMALTASSEIEKQGGDVNKVVRFLIVHKMGDALADDIISEKEMLGIPQKGEQNPKDEHQITRLKSYWVGYAFGTDPDARIARDMARLDLIHQSRHERPSFWGRLFGKTRV